MMFTSQVTAVIALLSVALAVSGSFLGIAVICRYRGVR